MLTLKLSNVELRGIANKMSGQGNVYYILYVENNEGKPYNFYVPKSEAFPEGLQKGDIINVLFDLTYYKGNERLSVCKVEKAV